jgi:signal peptidase I
MAEAKRSDRKEKPLSPRKLRKRAKDALSMGRWILRRRKKRLDEASAAELRSASDAVAAALKARDRGAIQRHGEALAQLLQGKLKPLRPKEWWLYLKGMLLFGGIAAVLRIVVFELFSIPSGSMLPTLQVGDRVVVNKTSYGLRIPFTYNPPRKGWNGRDPRRGEVVVFLHPEIPDREMVKRVIGLAGDTIKFQGGQVWIRKSAEAEFKPIPRTPKGKVQYCDYEPTDVWSKEENDAFEERHGDATYTTLGQSLSPDQMPNLPDREKHRRFKHAVENTRRHSGSHEVQGTEDTFGPVPPGHVFMLGDNREHSEDSRFWGTVPYDYLEGPVLFDLFSSGGELEKNCEVASGWTFWKNIRWGRFFKPID